MNTSEIKTKSNIGYRILAGIVDYSFIFSFSFIYIITYGNIDTEDNYSLNGIKSIIPVLIWGIMTIGIELLFGATVGNFLVGLKPLSIRKDSDNFGKKLNFTQSLKRHLLDSIDMMFFGLIGIITIKNTEKNQRLGDIWANTIVIKETELKNEK